MRCLTDIPGQRRAPPGSPGPAAGTAGSAKALLVPAAAAAPAPTGRQRKPGDFHPGEPSGQGSVSPARRGQSGTSARARTAPDASPSGAGGRRQPPALPAPRTPAALRGRRFPGNSWPCPSGSLPPPPAASPVRGAGAPRGGRLGAGERAQRRLRRLRGRGERGDSGAAARRPRPAAMRCGGAERRSSRGGSAPTPRSPGLRRASPLLPGPPVAAGRRRYPRPSPAAASESAAGAAARPSPPGPARRWQSRPAPRWLRAAPAGGRPGRGSPGPASRRRGARRPPMGMRMGPAMGLPPRADRTRGPPGSPTGGSGRWAVRSAGAGQGACDCHPRCAPPEDIGAAPNPPRFAGIPSPSLRWPLLWDGGKWDGTVSVRFCDSEPWSSELHIHFFVFLALQKAALPQDVKTRSEPIHSS